MKPFFLLAILLLTIPAFAQPAEPVSLRLRLSPGQTFRMRLSADQSITAQEKGKPTQKMTQTISFGLGFRVLAADDAGALLRVTMLGPTRYKRQTPDGKVSSFDSGLGQKPPEEVDFLTAGTGAAFQFKLSSQASIEKVLGLDAFYAKMLDNMKVSKDTRAFVLGVMQKSGGDRTLQNIGNTMASFPNEPVTLGATWKKRDPLSTDGALDYDTTCTLQRLVGSRAVIGVQSVLRPAAGTPATGQAGGTQTGFYEVDTRTGWTRFAALTLRIATNTPAVTGEIVSVLRLEPESL